MATIKPIEGASVHQIQSGQVIVDLCSVVKELVENCLDAKATSIDIRFKISGLEAIEVQDNGTGISKDDYASIALKHYTSKLLNYDDLASLQTYGFRGEALSSLCALSDVHIITAREDEVPKGTRLDFEKSGKLKGTQVVASQRGTTVAVETIFKNLPVRRQELERNIKREYSKVLGLLQAYACISTNVKITVSNVIAKGKKVVVFSTKSNPTTRDNIANVFGAKTLSALISLDLEFEMHTTAVKWSTQEEGGGKQVRVLGHVSRPVFGEGRQTPDRQMFFVNARPCGLPQLAKLMNEVYKSYNLSQSPFIFANVVVDTNAYDVNVSPDKRTILLHDQGALLDSIKTSLTELFEKQHHTVPQSQNPLQKLPAFKPPTISRQTSATSALEHSHGHIDLPQSDGSEDDPGTAQTESVPESQPGADVNGQATSLIHRFLGRKFQDRVPQFTSRATEETSNNPLSVDKQRLVKKLAGGSLQSDRIDGNEDACDLVASDFFAHGVDKHVLDFNQRIAEQQVIAGDVPSSLPIDDECDDDIPTLTGGPVKQMPGIVPNAFERMRSKRVPLQTATITVGDKTIVSSIGSSPSSQKLTRHKTPKRRIKYIPAKSSSSQQFGHSLKAFAASGSAIDGLASDGNDDDDDDDGDEDDEEEEQEQELDEDEGQEEEEDESTDNNEERVDETCRNHPFKLEDLGVPDKSFCGKTWGNSEEGIEDEPESDQASSEPRLESESDIDESSDEYLDDAGKKAKEEAKVAQLIRDAEEKSALPSLDNIERAKHVLKGGHRKDSALKLMLIVDTSTEKISRLVDMLERSIPDLVQQISNSSLTFACDKESAEERLSLTISKDDFARMYIVGQFNKGFILATRSTNPPAISSTHPRPSPSDLFIIDQHASDEIYNFERLQVSTTVQNQRLVHPHPLSLTALEEEIVLENPNALLANGFLLAIDDTGTSPVGQRCKVLSFPMSRETTFSLADLEELIALLADSPPASTGAVPRPSKVRKMFAMRACRSSVMVGKTLTKRQMEGLVTHMGEIDKPWNCPHGRPTMRHLAGLEKWEGWREGDGIAGLDEQENTSEVSWKKWMDGRTGGGDKMAEDVESTDDEEGEEMSDS